MIARKQGGIAYLAGRWPLDPRLPSVVFLHGSGQQGSFWQAQVDGLVDVANTIAVDLPGHGDSEGEGFCRVADYTRSVMDFITAIDAPSPIPCGLSLGGAIVLELLLDHARNFRAGILANTGARLKVLPVIIETVERDNDAHLKSLIEFAVAPVNRTDQETRRRVLACSTAPPTVTANDFRACNAFDVMDRVPDIDLPVLVLSADQDTLTPPKYAEWTTAQISGARHVRIHDAGHMSPIERPQDVNAAITRFLESLG